MKKKKQSGGAPKWMATFADMATLLMTFFVLMLSMSNTDVKKFKDMLGSVREAFGVQLKERGDYQAVISEDDYSFELKKDDKEPKKTKTASIEYDYEAGAIKAAVAQAEALEDARRGLAVSEIQKSIRKSDMGDMVQVRGGANGIRIRVKGALMFAPGKAELKIEARPFMDSLVLVLKKFGYFLLVEGHTDSLPITTERFPSNWELSGARASAVLRYLIAAGIASRQLSSVGLADNYPLASNNTPLGRAKNRRVEFVMTKTAFRPEIN